MSCQSQRSRRESPKHSLKTLAAALIAPTLFAAESGEPAATGKRDIKKGMMLPAVPGGGSVLNKFKRIKAAGFAGVEPRGSMNRDEVLSAEAATGLQIPSVCCATNWSKPLTDPDPSVRAEGLFGLETALNDAKAYGASSVLLVPGVVNEHISYDEAYDRSQTQIRKAIPLAEKLGVKIAIENVWNHFLLSPLEAVRYVDQFNSAAVGWHFDVGNVIAFGWPEQWIHALGKRIQKLHVKEYSRQKLNQGGMRAGFEVDYLEGDNDWPAVVKALDDIGYHGWAIAEPAYHPAGVDPAERLKQISAKIDKILGM